MSWRWSLMLDAGAVALAGVALGGTGVVVVQGLDRLASDQGQGWAVLFAEVLRLLLFGAPALAALVGFAVGARWRYVGRLRALSLSGISPRQGGAVIASVTGILALVLVGAHAWILWTWPSPSVRIVEGGVWFLSEEGPTRWRWTQGGLASEPMEGALAPPRRWGLWGISPLAVLGGLSGWGSGIGRHLGRGVIAVALLAAAGLWIGVGAEQAAAMRWSLGMAVGPAMALGLGAWLATRLGT
ncbi:MAG: hypothetical protein EA397_19955 [Deltaproteobacteria bacterium]|nr:MAG: hypothetical protein EA397_19955 [Deltaproteobacteria bacterium]